MHIFTKSPDSWDFEEKYHQIFHEITAFLWFRKKTTWFFMKSSDSWVFKKPLDFSRHHLVISWKNGDFLQNLENLVIREKIGWFLFTKPQESGDFVKNLVIFFYKSQEAGDFVKMCWFFTKFVKFGDFVKNLVFFPDHLVLSWKM